MTQVMAIVPRWDTELQTWLFDDPAKGLHRELFVGGIPEIIDAAVAAIPAARSGFRLVFSAGPFPGHQVQLDWVRGDQTGNWYRNVATGAEGWLCPALFKYFDEAPAQIYAKAEALAIE